MILIAIEDAGIGIPEGARGELFQPFKQVQRLAGGTGLGLYSLSNRIRALKGMRGVKSRNDNKQGSVFWFAIPYRPDIEYSSCNTRRSSIVTTPKLSSRKGSMSIDVTSASRTAATYPSIDSTSPVAHLTSAFGMYTTTPATNQRFQFLVVDDSPSIFIIGMSANSDEHTKQCAFEAGMNAFLAKPFTIADLMPVLQHILLTATADE